MLSVAKDQEAFVRWYTIYLSENGEEWLRDAKAAGNVDVDSLWDKLRDCFGRQVWARGAMNCTHMSEDCESNEASMRPNATSESMPADKGFETPADVGVSEMHHGFDRYQYSSSFVEATEEDDDASATDPTVRVFSTSKFMDFAMRRGAGMPYGGCVDEPKGTGFDGHETTIKDRLNFLPVEMAQRETSPGDPD